MNISRTWAMPHADTFTVTPIGEFVQSYLSGSKISIDPFARNRNWATYNNDLNPETSAESHLEAAEFLRGLVERGVKADLIIFDPPYSTQQCREVYEKVGLPVTREENSTWGGWYEHKDLCEKLLTEDGVFLHFGWHSNGMGKKRGFVIETVLLVAHGRAHHDTICIAEKRTSQPLFRDNGADSETTEIADSENMKALEILKLEASR